MAQITGSSAKAPNTKPFNISQNTFPLGYVSSTANSRRSQKSVSDATNMELVQDNIWRPRAPLVRYGVQPNNPVIGRGKFRYNGQRGMLFMLNVSGVGKVYYQTNGGVMTLVGGANSFMVNAGYALFVQSTNRVYIYNGTSTGTGDYLAWIDLTTWTVVVQTALATPAAPTLTASANLTSGSTPYKYYYSWTANNGVGESMASPSSLAVSVNDIRDNWGTSAGKTVTVNGTLVTGATSYTLYGGTSALPSQQYEIITIANPTTLSYVDDGSLTLNPFKTAPASNSTQGYIFIWMYVDTRNAQVYGVTADNKFCYAAPGTADFSALNGGGFTTIDQGGDTQLNFVDGFHTGKGDPVITTSSRGAAGKGKFNHITFDSATYGDQVIFYPNVTEANGQSGTYAPRATVKSGDQLIFPTGDNIKSYGTSANVVNVLSTAGLANGPDGVHGILPDVNQINLQALSNNACAVESQDVVYFCFPVNSTTNNEIWQLYRSKNNVWGLRWTIPATDIWLYEDNNGYSHLCVLVNNVILEFNRNAGQQTNDDGVPFSTRLAYSSLTWDADGLSLGNVHNMYFKLLQPMGNIAVNTYGLTKRGATTDTGSGSYGVDVSFTGIGTWDYFGNYQYGDPIDSITQTSQAISVIHIRPKGLLNQLDWEIVTTTAGCDYLSSAVSTRGSANLDLIYQGI